MILCVQVREVVDSYNLSDLKSGEKNVRFAENVYGNDDVHVQHAHDDAYPKFQLALFHIRIRALKTASGSS